MATIAAETERPRPLMLADVVRVRQRFLRSVNLERDFYRYAPLDGYVPTESALKSFERLAAGIPNAAERAFTITGPYGTGKSAFALFAARAMAATETGSNPVRERAREKAVNVSRTFFPDENHGFWPILITGNREPIGRALVRGLVSALDQLPYKGAAETKARLQRTCADVLGADSPTAREVVRVFQEAAAGACRTSELCRGLLVVVDELGKFLEYAANYPTQSDMHVLQELAECATRSAEAPILLVTILHQAFEDYAHRLGALQRNEWQKVQGRFTDIPFGDGPEVVLALVAEAIEHSPAPELEAVVERTLAENLKTCEALQLFPDRITSAEFREILRKTFPLHPLTLLVMPHLFRRFGQNERSLFSFLAGDDPFGFQEFLRTRAIDAGEAPILGIEYLYDYVIATMGAAVYSHATAKLWSETEEALFRVRDRDPLQARLVKVIGLLSILGEQTKILPKADALVFALADGRTRREEVQAAINALAAGTVITYRQFKQAYRLYEGSDIDIDARLKEARAHFSQGADAVKLAQRLGSNPPIVARRHSYETGTLRYFDVRYCRARELEKELLGGPKQGHGLLLLCLAADARELETARGTIEAVLPQCPHAIVGLNVETEGLHEAAVAVETLTWVQEQTPELRNDRVATREVRERLLDAQNTFQTEWDRLLRPHSGASTGSWYYQGEEQALSSYRALQELVSRACDQAYDKTPRLLNELVNRRQLSSSAAAARGKLIEAMIAHRHEPRLGLNGYPPEYSIYASILLETKIHAPVEDGEYDFCIPDHDPALLAVWEAIEGFVFAEELPERSVPRLYEILRARPFGLADGVIPVLLCAFLLSNEAEVAVYEDGAFVAEPDAATFERMIRRPGDFQLRGSVIEGERRAVLQRFARGLLREGLPVTLVSVAREVFRQFEHLPEFTWKTRQLPARAIVLRDLLKHAREPERLLFTEFPLALGGRPFSSDGGPSEYIEEFFERWNEAAKEVIEAYPALLGRIERELLRALSAQGWIEIRARAAELLDFVSEPRLKAFVLRASDEELQRAKWLESVAAGIVGKPPVGWSDADEHRYRAALPGLVSAFHHTELVAFEKKRGAGEDTAGMRLAVTLDSGAEAARVVVLTRDQSGRVEELTSRVLKAIEATLRGEPEDVRVAVIGQVAQAIIRGEHG